MKFKKNSNEAVSPVVGVMLMLVVVIIIAAVVSAFAGGLATSTEKAPSAAIKIGDYNITVYDNGYGDNNHDVTNMTFIHMGGDALTLSKTKILLEKDAASMSYDLTEFDSNKDGKWTAGEILEIHKKEGASSYGVLGQSLVSDTEISWKVLTSDGKIIANGKYVIKYY